MFDINRKIYIIEKACGKVIKIAFNHNMEIRISTLSKNEIWFEPPPSNLKFLESCWTSESLVCRDVQPRFGACIDSKDAIHILCQNNTKSVIHVHLNNNMEIHSKVINCECGNITQDRYPDVFTAGGKVVLLYLNSHPYHTQIILQVLDHDGSVSPPQLLDNVAYGKIPYTVVIDTLKCPYLFYKKKIGSDYVLGYKKYLESTDSWTDFYTICTCASESDILSAAVDYLGNIYLIWQMKMGQMVDMICTVKSSDNKKSWNSKITCSSDHPFHNSSILAIGTLIIIYWVKNTCILYCISIDNGHTWKSQESYDFHDISPLYCISYKSNSRGKYTDNCINPLPGKIAKNLRLAFLNDFSARPENMAIEEVRLVICHLIKQQSHDMELLKQQSNAIEALKQITNSINKRIDDINEKLNNFEQKFHNEAEKKKARIKRTPTADDIEKDPNTSLMSGTGFANITEEYLKSLRKK